MSIKAGDQVTKPWKSNDNIVERMRNDPEHMQRDFREALILEAADDIEWLREQIEKHVQLGIRLGERAEKAEAELERLRKAILTLDDILAGYVDWSNKPHNAKWARKIDGTPIANDICVCIFNRLRAMKGNASD